MENRQKVIIFDGPDGCGKTNIAKSLGEKLNISVFKNEMEWESFEDDPTYFKNAMIYGDPYFASYLKQTGASVIMDRWYPSEWVYPRVFHRETDHDALEKIDKVVSKLNTIIVIPYRTSYEGIKDQFESITERRMRDIDMMYTYFAAWTKCKVMRLNVDDENLEREVNEILNFMEDIDEGSI